MHFDKDTMSIKKNTANDTLIDNFSLILTCTIAPKKNMPYLARSSVKDRRDDYLYAFSKWLDNECIKNIIFIENSGSPINDFIILYKSHMRYKSINVEFLSADLRNHPQRLGKGYGEQKCLKYILNKSKQIQKTRRFIKCTGRYYVTNASKILKKFTLDTDCFCEVNKNLLWADSRFFGGSLEFIEIICKNGSEVDDSNGIYFEHILAKSFLMGISKRLKWQFIPYPLLIDGISGTTGLRITSSYIGYLKRTLRKRIYEFFFKHT